jgi:hypothetical protein
MSEDINQEDTVSDLTSTIDTYFAAWNETGAPRRAELIEQVWAPAGRLIDPPLTGEGHQGISHMIAAAHGQFPGCKFRRVSAVDTHHDQLRVAWELVTPDGTVAVAGTDVGEIDDQGRLVRMVGFFGPIPA